MTRRLRAWAGAVLLAGLGACASVPKPLEGGSDAFSRVGRFAITVTEDGGRQQAVQGGFAWRDNGSRYRLDLTNPLGSTQARVDGQPGLATLTKADGERLTAEGPDSLAEEALGSPVPVQGLRDWLRGRLAGEPPAADLQQDDQGRPIAFGQGGWTAKLSRYDALGPQLLVLQRQEPGRRISVRLVVDTSKLP